MQCSLVSMSVQSLRSRIQPINSDTDVSPYNDAKLYSTILFVSPVCLLVHCYNIFKFPRQIGFSLPDEGKQFLLGASLSEDIFIALSICPFFFSPFFYKTTPSQPTNNF